MLFSSRVRVMVRFGVWLDSDYAHIFFIGQLLLSTLAVTVPQLTDK